MPNSERSMTLFIYTLPTSSKCCTISSDTIQLYFWVPTENQAHFETLKLNSPIFLLNPLFSLKTGMKFSLFFCIYNYECSLKFTKSILILDIDNKVYIRRMISSVWYIYKWTWKMLNNLSYKVFSIFFLVLYGHRHEVISKYQNHTNLIASQVRLSIWHS